MIDNFHSRHVCKCTYDVHPHVVVMFMQSSGVCIVWVKSGEEVHIILKMKGFGGIAATRLLPRPNGAYPLWKNWQKSWKQACFWRKAVCQEESLPTGFAAFRVGLQVMIDRCLPLAGGTWIQPRLTGCRSVILTERREDPGVCTGLALQDQAGLNLVCGAPGYNTEHSDQWTWGGSSNTAGSSGGHINRTKALSPIPLNFKDL